MNQNTHLENLNSIKTTLRDFIYKDFGTLKRFCIKNNLVMQTIRNFLSPLSNENVGMMFSNFIKLLEITNYKFKTNSDIINEDIDKYGSLSIGLNLKKIREQKQVSKSKLRLLARLSNGYNIITNIEEGKADFNIKYLIMFLNVLDISIKIVLKDSPVNNNAVIIL